MLRIRSVDTCNNLFAFSEEPGRRVISQTRLSSLGRRKRNPSSRRAINRLCVFPAVALLNERIALFSPVEAVAKVKRVGRHAICRTRSQCIVYGHRQELQRRSSTESLQRRGKPFLRLGSNNIVVHSGDQIAEFICPLRQLARYLAPLPAIFRSLAMPPI